MRSSALFSRDTTAIVASCTRLQCTPHIPAHRRKGLGAKFVHHAEGALTVRGYMKINLQIVSTNESVKTFYESLGYSTEPRISMGKKIESNIPMPRE